MNSGSQIVNILKEIPVDELGSYVVCDQSEVAIFPPSF